MSAFFLFPPYWLRDTVPALNQSESALKIVNVKQSKVKEKPLASQFQGVNVSRESLRSYLEFAFTKEGIRDEIPMAEATIACESSWNIHADNGVSYGIAQYTRATWKDFGYGDIMNPQSQITVMSKMWVKPELRKRWDCFTGKR